MHTLLLHRRHRPACSAKHPVDSYTTEAEERRKNWKKCACKIYAHGTLNGVFRKFATRARDWERAQEAVAPFLAAGTWDAPAQPPPPAAPPPKAPEPSPENSGTPVADAIRDYLKEHENAKSAENTVKKYRQVLGQFARFSAHLGLRFIEEWKPRHVRQLRASWGNSPLTTQKKLSNLKAFFEMFVEDEILESNPARIKTLHNRAIGKGTGSKQKNPYTDPELERMLAGCRDLEKLAGLRRWPKKRNGRQVVAITAYRDYHRKWRGEDLADFIQLSYFTGLRISDVATFSVDRLTAEGEVRVRATKNGNWVSVWIPEWLRARIHARAARLGPRIFGKHRTTDLNVITDVWRRKLNALWAKCGPWEQKPTHHRFRHTFIRMLLERGAPLRVIADLTGDTEKMIEKHYSAWMPGRQQSTSRIVAEAFRDVPRFYA